MSDQHTLHFSFSPVQSFVSQSRRTRDLWAGSYLLSWLTGKAMLAITAKGGEILLPDVTNDPLSRQISSPGPVALTDRATYLGSLPNRFTALVPEHLDGTVCVNAINGAWQQVAQEVYAIVGSFFSPAQTNLWKRQTTNFWEYTWVIGDATYLLDWRKNLRLHTTPPEQGEKCTICGKRQELSAEEFPNRTKIKGWWKKLQQGTADEKIHGLDLKEYECLCSICLIKRLFPHIAPKTIGWQVPEFYPSTDYLSAIDWIIHVLELAKEHEDVRDAASDFLKNIQTPIIAKAEQCTWRRINKIIELTNRVPSLKGFLHVDGALFFKDAIFQDDLDLSDPERKEIAGALARLQRFVAQKTPNFSTASPFYALLLMDGDNMGALIGDKSAAERKKISQALSSFTGKVPDIVHDLNGMLVYAGGDDVFAFLPVSTAIECARRCREAYQCSFQEYAPFIPKDQATISAAIQYAHMNTALGTVVKDAHRLLDETAKDRTGRDALACRVWKRGGPILTWAQPWMAIDDGSLVSEVQLAFSDENDEPDNFSSKFFYKLRDFFKLVDSDGFLAGTQDIKDLLVVEYLANREHSWPEDTSRQEILERSGKRVEQLLSLCLVRRRIVDENGRATIVSKGRYSNSAALLVRFLNQKEV